MIVLGLTGSIGMGKSTTAQMFRSQNIPVHDADHTVHELYKNEAVAPLTKLFPSAVTNNTVDRKILGGIVLENSDQMKLLENIVHPLVWQKEQEFLVKSRADGAFLVVLDIPLLFETGGDKRVDAVLVVTASAQIQKQRVLAREDMSEQKFNSILKRQLPDIEKRKKADFVIDTGNGLGPALEDVKKIIAKYRRGKHA